MNLFKKIIPILSAVLAIAVQILVPRSSLHPQSKPYFTYVLIGILSVYLIFFIASFRSKKLNEKLVYRGYFIGGVILFFNILNLLTAKLALLPILYFPSLDRVFGVMAEEYDVLIKCILYSLRLLGLGIFFGALIGIITGICLGFSKSFSYWISPVIRILGPIPSTAWIPLVLISFPSAVSASAFLVGLAVWFPTTLMTSSGISNIQNSYFEISGTLGAGHLYQVFKVGIPAAMPNMFLGLFNGICSSFITLVTAEMIGAKYGIGWYINWQKEMLSYANVYAGLIIIAVLFSVLITLLFRVRDRFLNWQKGVIKW
ncbi:MAG: ABC transporter permease subunit [Oscillospiraceae bacterium]|nr:ABC transporter permease subunit [Oscillospiraceae bacterium]